MDSMLLVVGKSAIDRPCPALSLIQNQGRRAPGRFNHALNKSSANSTDEETGFVNTNPQYVCANLIRLLAYRQDVIRAAKRS